MKFTVQGTGVFPFDMLRYDRCFPASSEAASNMGDDRMYNHVTREVELTSDQKRGWRPTEARWRSFSWRIIKWEQ